MKKIDKKIMKQTLIVGFLLSSVLYASDEHTRNHLHEGKMMNHTTTDGKITLFEAGNDAFGTIQEVIKNLNSQS